MESEGKRGNRNRKKTRTHTISLGPWNSLNLMSWSWVAKDRCLEMITPMKIEFTMYKTHERSIHG